ncbi:MAG: hypothetical protein U1E02_10555 [Hydrogenophaga sp.]|nr:hypothetical protein [Hydrogenophaga sp.]
MKNINKTCILAVLSLLTPIKLSCMAIRSDGSLLVYEKAKEEQSPMFQQWLQDHQHESRTPEYKEAKLLEQVKTQSPEYQAWFKEYQKAKQNNTLHRPIRLPYCAPMPEISPAAWEEAIKRIRSIR